MKMRGINLLWLALLLVNVLNAQSNAAKDSLAATGKFSGLASAFVLFNPDNDLNFYGGARYIPQLNIAKKLPQKQLIDLEASANIFGTLGFQSFNETASNGDIRPYRAWLRYSRPQLEIRAGLQKINFGSATILRPLMWFDQVDPRDPLQLTDGVWGVLGRYYFLNNANVWLWSLYGNKNRRGFDVLPTAKEQPEFGGRFQLPTENGEVATTYHYRQVPRLTFGTTESIHTPEHRIAFDGKWDWTVGFWVETSWIFQPQTNSVVSHQHLLNIGTDYTFGVGNGINVIAEQLFFSVNEQAFALNDLTTLTAISANYPLGLFDNLQAIIYYDWTQQKIYNTIQLQHQFAQWTLNVLAFWNPQEAQLPQQTMNENLFGGKGIQLLAVYKH